MSFFKKLFGGGGSGPAEVAADPVEYKGYRIAPMPFQEEGQFQTCGVISREVDGELREHRFIRADRFANKDDAIDTSVRKARQMIDEQGDRIFG